MSRLIRQGGFGCLFHPGFNCQGESDPSLQNKASKLQKDDFAARNEIYIGSLVAKIPNYNLFFLPAINSCSISLAHLNKKFMEKCKIISQDEPNYILLELPYIKHISFGQLFSDRFRTNKHLFITFIETYNYVVTSIKLLLDINVVHYDLKKDNILFSLKYENPILIDFGLSIPIDKITNSDLADYFYVYAPDYYLWPLEVHAINYIVNISDTFSSHVIEQLVETYISMNSALEIFTRDFKENYRRSAIKFLKKYENMNKSDIIKELILPFYKTWDLYALSIMYLKFFKIVFNDGFFDSNLIVSFSQLLLINISPNPANRLSIENTGRKYRDIFYINEKPANYFALIDNLDYCTVKHKT
jgi:serine/threonine protein kinase